MMVAGKAIGNAVYYLPFSYVAIVALSLSKKNTFCNLSISQLIIDIAPDVK
jgi:uncharacterized membrane protein YecN with MAPEG domain